MIRMDTVDLEPLEEGDDLLLPAPPQIKIKTETTIEGTYKVLEELGKGKFGVVKKCQDTATGIFHAAKYVKKTKQSKQDVTNEIEMMGKLHHKGLVQLIDAFETKQFMIVVMELITGGELFEKVVEEDNLTERQVVRYLRQVLFAVQHMHRYSMVHLDLKPENILCVGGDPPGYEKLKLIDFGMARVLVKGKDEIAACGTAEFVAPEVLRLEPIGLAADMWSLGVITYVLLSGLSPFLGDNDNETLYNVAHGDYDFDDGEGIFDQISDIAKQFMEGLLIMDVKKRYTVDECLEHDWLMRANEKKLKTDKLRKFIARRRWQKTTNALKALNRLGQMGLLHRSANAKSNEQNSSQVSSKESEVKNNSEVTDLSSKLMAAKNKIADDANHAAPEKTGNGMQAKNNQPSGDKKDDFKPESLVDKKQDDCPKQNKTEAATAKNDKGIERHQEKLASNASLKQDEVEKHKTPEAQTPIQSGRQLKHDESEKRDEQQISNKRDKDGPSNDHHGQTEKVATKANVETNIDHNDNDVTEPKGMIVVNMNDLKNKDDVIHVHIDSVNLSITKN